MRILMLMQDAFGGRGGIAQLGRDLVAAVAADPDVHALRVLPRRIVEREGAIPPAIDWRRRAAGGRAAFVAATAAAFLRPWDRIVYGHVNFLPLETLPRIGRTRTTLLLYGIDAWSPVGGPAMRRRLAALDSVLAISDVTRDRFLAWSGVDPARVGLLPCMVDPARFGPGAPPADLAARYGLAGRRVLMTLARLAGTERYKGIDEVMAAIPTLLPAFPDLAYLIVGDGDDRPRLMAKARELAIADRVVFAGYVDEAEKADHYRLADVFVLAGRGEGFGIVLLEAMACGIPVVGSRLDASGDVVRTAGGGVVVDPDDPAGLAAGLAAALRLPRGTVPAGLAPFGPAAFRDHVRRALVGAAP